MLKLSRCSEQVCGLAKVHLVCIHAALRIIRLDEVCGVRRALIKSGMRALRVVVPVLSR